MRWFTLIVISTTLLAASDRRKPPVLPRGGVKTPGIQIPFEKLKPEAQIPISGIQASAIFLDQLWISTEQHLARVDLKANKLADPVTTIQNVCAGLVMAFDALWAPSCGEASTLRLDPKKTEVKHKLEIGASKSNLGVAATADSIWLLSDDKVTLSRVDPVENRVVAEIRVPAGCNSLLFANDSLWVTCPYENQVLRVDPLRNLVDKRVDVAEEPRAAVFAQGSLWVLCQKDGKVSRVDPKTLKTTATIDLGVRDSEGEIAAGAGSIWVSAKGFPITRIDPANDQVVQQFSGEGGTSIRFGADSVWLIDTKRGLLSRYDPRRITATLAE